MKPKKSLINLLARLMGQARKTRSTQDLQVLLTAYNSAVEIHEADWINMYFSNDELVIVEEAQVTMARMARIKNK